MARQITEHSKKQLDLTLLSVSDYTHSPLYIDTHINHKHTHTHTHTHTQYRCLRYNRFLQYTQHTQTNTHTLYHCFCKTHTHTHTRTQGSLFCNSPGTEVCNVCWLVPVSSSLHPQPKRLTGASKQLNIHHPPSILRRGGQGALVAIW